MAVVFYAWIILAVGHVLNPAEIAASQSGTGLVTADAMGKYKVKHYKFGIFVEIISDEDAAALQSSDEEISAALDIAIDAAINKILAQRKVMVQ